MFCCLKPKVNIYCYFYLSRNLHTQEQKILVSKAVVMQILKQAKQYSYFHLYTSPNNQNLITGIRKTSDAVFLTSWLTWGKTFKLSMLQFPYK